MSVSTNEIPKTRPWWMRAASTLGRHARDLVWGVALFVLFFVGWEVIVHVTNQEEYILPAPSVIIETAWTRADDTLLPATYVTLIEILGGFALAFAIAMPLAILIAHSRVLARALNPLIVSSQTIPVIAIAPLFIIWFGFGAMPKIMIAALIAFFPIVINATAGLQSVDRDTINLMRSLSASPIATFVKVRFPASLPYLFTGLKQAAVICVIGAIVGEWVGATDGLGPVMLTANAAFQTPLVFAAILYLSVIGIALFLIVVGLERVVIRWHFITRAEHRQ
jgi:NitT/TauT family transport system permease protein